MGIGNVDTDPIFVSGPWGGYYLSQKSAGQEFDSPCLNKGGTATLGFDYTSYTTRTDGIFDSGRIDMGYHYTPHLNFDLKIISNGESSVDNSVQHNIFLDLKTAPRPINADIYLVMIDPHTNFYSALDWMPGILPFIQNVEIPGRTDLDDLMLFSFFAPSDYPPVRKKGLYTFAIAGTKPGSIELLSNTPTASFIHKDE